MSTDLIHAIMCCRVARSVRATLIIMAVGFLAPPLAYADDPYAVVTLTFERDAASASYSFKNLNQGKAYYTLTEFLNSAKVTSDASSPPHVYGWLRRTPASTHQEVIVGVAHNTSRDVKINILNSTTPKSQAEELQTAKVSYTLGFPDQDPIGDLDERLQGLFAPVKKLIVYRPESWATTTVTPSPNNTGILPGRTEIGISGPGQILIEITPTGGVGAADIFSIVVKNIGVLLAIVGIIATLSAMTHDTPYGKHIRIIVFILAITLVLFNIASYLDMSSIAAFLRDYAMLLAANVSLIIGALWFRQLESLVTRLKALT